MVVKVYVDTNEGPDYIVIKASNAVEMNRKINKVLCSVGITAYSHEEIIEQ